VSSAKLKPLNQQVMVITGASSGIGLATAQAAARQGVKLVLAARSARALEEVAAGFRTGGAEAFAVPCDVTDRKQVDALAQAAVSRFGRIDTWVNNAGLGIYGWLHEVTEADARRLFDVNYWGVVNGSLAALPHLKRDGGALINVGSEVSDAFMPLMGTYTASKHAVKGFTSALRVEVEEIEKAPVSITLIQPTAVDTPFPQHARNYMSQEPKLPPPMIQPSDVADAILEAAVTPTRDRTVGTRATITDLIAKLVPGMADKMTSGQAGTLQYQEPPRHPEGSLYRSSEEATGVVGQTHGTGGKTA